MNGESDPSFGDLLRQLRKKALLTQEELAERAGLGMRTVQDLERGVNQTARPATARQLASGLGLSGLGQEQFLAAAGGQRAAAERGMQHSLPPDTVAFSGRDLEFERIMAAVTRAAGVGGVVVIQAIDGMPGVGKTALAVHAAHAVTGQFPDRQMFIDLHAHTPGRDPVRPEDALAVLLAAIGLDPRFLPGDLDGRAGMWRDRMARQKALIVLDNAASSSQVAPLLPGGKGCLVLVTSRRHLGDLPGSVAPVLLDALPPQQAAKMFTQLAARASDSPAEIAEVVRLAGFLPLAISLLARVFARHQSWTLADLITETRMGLLTMTAENASVGAAFEVSYMHLAPSLQRMFRLLGLHPGATLDRYAAAALANSSLEEAVRLLDRLQGEGLLTETGYHRYGMHDLLRRYARDLATASSAVDSQRALNRLLDYYQHTGARAEALLARQTRPALPRAPAPSAAPVLEGAEQALAWLRAERPSLLASLDLVTAATQDRRVILLTAALAALLRRDGPWAEATGRHTAAFEAAQRLGDQLGEATALTNLGTVHRDKGDYPAAAQALQQALDIYRSLGDQLGEATALDSLGTVHRDKGDYPAAAQALQQALGICRSLGDQLGEATALSDLGTVWRLMSDYPAAVQAYEQALGICRSLGDRFGEATALSNLGNVRLQTGNYPTAVQALEEALDIFRGLGYRLGEANTLNNLGITRRRTSDYPAAVQALEQALGIYREIGRRRGEASALNELGGVWREIGDYQAAARALEQALSIFHTINLRAGEADTLNDLGTLHRAGGELTPAAECHQQALEIARAIANPWNEAHALAGLGRCALAIGNATQARRLLQEALEIFQRIGAAEARNVLNDLDGLTS